VFSPITVAVFERVVHQGGAPCHIRPGPGPGVGSSLVMAAMVTSIRMKILIWTLILTDHDHLLAHWSGGVVLTFTIKPKRYYRQMR
jgi:hypothetical protein